jgi:hypothetical protein
MDNMSRQNHYNIGNIQPIDLIQSQKLNFAEGNVVKYVCRHKHKEGLKDLEKALTYLVWLYIEESLKKEDIEWTVNKEFGSVLKHRLPDYSNLMIAEISSCIENIKKELIKNERIE